MDGRSHHQLTAEFKLGVAAALENIAHQLTSRSEALAQIDAAIHAQQERLAELHDIELAADSLAVLIDQNDRAEHEERLAVRQAEARAAFEAAKADVVAQVATAKESFAAEMTRTRLEWDEEQRLHERDKAASARSTSTRPSSSGSREVRAFEEEKAGRERELSEREQRVAVQEQELAAMRTELEAVTLPDASVIDNLARSLGRLLAPRMSG